MRKLLKYTVNTAIELDLVDLAVQAVDGTKIAANAAGDRTYDADDLQRLLNRPETAISELESQNEGGNDAPLPRLPEELQKAKELQQRIKDAMHHLVQQERTKKINLTDEDAQLMKGRNGIITGYNAQTMVSPLNPEKAKGKGMLITAVEVVKSASDYGQLAPMLVKAEEITKQRVPITLADGGHNTVASLEAGLRRGQTLVMAERNNREEKNPYFKDNFIFDSQTDSYICPQEKRLPFRGIGQSKFHASGPYRIYRASRTDCRTCPAFGTCMKDKHSGRALWISASDELLRKHRQWMETDEARTLYARRKEISEPTFGILKDQMNTRKFLLRGLVNVRAEFNLMATAFNLRTLWRIWSKLERPGSNIHTIIPDRLANPILINLFFDTNHKMTSVLNFA